MNCDEALLAISAALDGELSPRERLKLSEHLLQCDACRELAEDLRVLTEELGRSSQEVPPELADAVRRAVAEEAPVRRKRPYLRTAAAMLALCVGLGGIGLFASGRMGMKSMKDASTGGAAPALYRGAPESREKSAGAGMNGGLEDDGAAPDWECAPEAPAEAALIPLPEDAPLPMPSSAPDPEAPAASDKWEGAAFGSTEDGEDKAVITPEEALELVFAYLGGYESFSEAEITEMPVQFTATQVYPPSMCLIPDHAAGSGDENDQHSSTWLTYYGLTPNGRYHQFWLFNQIGYSDGEGRGSTLNFFAVSLDGSELLAERTDEGEVETYRDAIGS